MNSPRRRGLCLVLSAPSGAGKSTIARALRENDPQVTVSISVTTRAPRPGERHGIDYFFLTEPEFTRMTQTGELLEWAPVFAHHYGTPKAPVEAALAAGLDVIFDIDWQGHQQLRAALPTDVVSIFILPPTLETLRTRLAARAGDSEAVIEARMAQARAEISHWREYDYLVINDDLTRAIADSRAILTAARAAVSRQMFDTAPEG